MLNDWSVWKFGGSSLANFERMLNSAELVVNHIEQHIYNEIDCNSDDSGSSQTIQAASSGAQRDSQLRAVNSSSSNSDITIDSTNTILSDKHTPNVISTEMSKTSISGVSEPVTNHSETNSHCSGSCNALPLGRSHMCVVVSAMQGTTDALAEALALAADVTGLSEGVTPRTKARSPIKQPSKDTSSIVSGKPSLTTFYREDLKTARASATYSSSRVARSCFLMEADTALRRLDSHIVCSALRMMSYSDRWSGPLLRIVNSHVDVIEKLQQCFTTSKITSPKLSTKPPIVMKTSGLVSELETFRTSFVSDLISLFAILQCVSLTGKVTVEQTAVVTGYGEVWSSNLFRIVLAWTLKLKTINNAILRTMNAREVVVVQASDEAVSNRSSDYYNRKLWNSVRINSETILTEENTFPNNSNNSGDLSPPPVMQFVPSLALSKTHTPVKDYDNAIGLAHSEAVCPREFDAGDWFPPPIKSKELGYTFPDIDYAESYCLLRKWIQSNAPSQTDICKYRMVNSPDQLFFYTIVTSGFICRTHMGYPRTLQRNGSDVTAAVMGVLLRAVGVTIWSDVDGIYTSDPRTVSEAVPIPFVSFEEAMELACFGARVLHPATILPLSHTAMTLWLKSSWCPSKCGTLVASTDILKRQPGYHLTPTGGKMVTVLRDVSLITIQCFPLCSITALMTRLFGAIEHSNGHPLLLSQTSSRSALTVALLGQDRDNVVQSVFDEFKFDVQNVGSSGIQIIIDDDCSIVSIVGSNLCGRTGAMGACCTALGRAKVNIKALSQGSNEISISFVVSSDTSLLATKVLHDFVLQKLDSS